MLRPVYALLALLFVVACEAPAVEWNDPVEITNPPGTNAALVIDPSGTAHFAADTLHARQLPSVPGLCANTLRLATGTNRLFAAWWSVRHDSSSVLYSAESEDGGTSWNAPSPVDTTDISSRGCNRPPPSLATVGNDLYVAYSMAAPEGTGVFFAHYMDSMLHSPVSVIYGERLVATAIATEGNRVAVAYEEPNGTRQQVDVALSATQGHIFEKHLTASRSVDVARAPRVALGGDRIAVSWAAMSPDGAIASYAVRTGIVR